MTRNRDDRTMRSSKPFASATEQELDSMLGMLVPPQPSDTLRARLKRDFASAASERASRPGRRRWGAFDGRVGGMAVAAALVLAVALGTLVPGTPEPERPAVATVQADAASALYARDEDAAVGDDMLATALADGAPDSAAFMVATFDATARGAYTDASDGLLTNASYDVGFGVPLE